MTLTPNAANSSRQLLAVSYGDYIRFSKLLLERCGLYFPENRRSELEYRLRLAFASSTCANLDEFYTLLQDPKAGAIEMDILVNAITISETHFFRDAAQFNALYEQVLPKIIERKRPQRVLRIWSAGCSSGEEPYSIAMMLRELIPDIQNWALTLLATDINTASLDRARNGIYGTWAFREARALEMRNRYFQPVGNRFKLADDIRSMVSFNKLNLVEPAYPSYETNTTSLDLIICRNVTIYFSEATTRWVVDRFYDCLLDGGWLVVGHSEPSLDIYRRFRVRNFPDTILYQRIPETGGLRWPGAPLTTTPTVIPPPPLTQLAPMPTPSNQPIALVTDPSMIASPKQQTNPLEEARELIEYGHVEQALQLLQKAAASQPNDAAISALLGQAYADLGDWQKAENWCQQAIRLDKIYLDAYYTLALVHQHNEQLEQAIEMMKKVVYLDRNYILGHYGLATLYHASGLFPQAQKSLDNALRLLVGQAADTIIPGSRGVTVGRLKESVIRQQQAWNLG